MKIKQLLDEDFVNYKKPSMFIAFPSCTFKCDKECGERVCQNSALANAQSIEVNVEDIVNRYINNDITCAVVIGGLEPFDDFDQLYEFITKLREVNYDDIVIYTGYKLDEIEGKINILCKFDNIIVKFGRFIPNDSKRYDHVLGIYLASKNQYAIEISRGEK